MVGCTTKVCGNYLQIRTAASRFSPAMTFPVPVKYKGELKRSEPENNHIVRAPASATLRHSITISLINFEMWTTSSFRATARSSLLPSSSVLSSQLQPKLYPTRFLYNVYRRRRISTLPSNPHIVRVYSPPQVPISPYTSGY